MARDWDDFDLERLADGIRAATVAPDAEKTIWAFEQAVRVARIDEELLEYVFVACLCLLARAGACSPRTVLEVFFRRSVSDESWRRDVLPLFG
jgi:hypothetical protein